MNCILNVTNREFDRILQLNHDELVWSTEDSTLLNRLSYLVGADAVEEMRHYDECRMEKQDKIRGIYRIEPDLVAIA